MEATGSCELLFTTYNTTHIYNHKGHYLTFNI